MAEPVGNSPRSMGDIPGNSHRERASAPETETEAPEPVTKIVEGDVSMRKQRWYKRFAHSLVAEDAGNIGDYIMTDVVVPSIKRLISEMVRGGTDRVLYGSVQPRGAVGDRPGLRTRYDRVAEPEPRRLMSREARASHDFREVVLREREEAILVVESLIDRVGRFGTASVADLYDFLGVTGSYADRNYGWRDLRSADVRQVSGGWLLDLPKPELLR